MLESRCLASRAIEYAVGISVPIEVEVFREELQPSNPVLDRKSVV